jgi:two-component system nitrate/nitrite response regulator NarL
MVNRSSRLDDSLMPAFRAFVADDHPLYREGVVQALRETAEVEVVGEAANGTDALAGITRLAPDVAVLDMGLPGLTGIEVLAGITRAGLATRVLFLSAYLESDLVYDALAHGALGYLSKDSGRDEITGAVLAVARGESVLSRDVQGGLAEQIRRRESESRPRLTPREQEVLRLIAEGCSAPEVGRRLYLSSSTVKTHLQRIYEKLGVSERAAAVAEAMRRGLLE